MSQPVRIDLHARRSSDLPALRPLLDALGEPVELSAAEEIGEGERAGLSIGPLPRSVRVMVAGCGEFPSISAERLIVLLDTLEPAESMRLTDLIHQAELVLTPSQSQADSLASRLSAGVVAIHGLVQACFQMGDLQPAECRVSAYLESHPGNLDMAFTLAGLRSQLGDPPGALEMIERIELFDPQYSGLAELREKVETG